jgi:soluble lytic murein transglycosylase-like protein
MLPVLFAAAVAAAMPRAALLYRDMLISEARFAMGQAAPVALLGGQIHQESGYDPNARSSFASGLAQFTPQTADWISGVYKDLGPAMPTDPQWAIRALVRYDKRLYDGVRPADSDCDRWAFALSDYNGGAGRRLERQRRSPMPGNYAVTAIINPGIAQANQRENQDYPPRILYRWQPVYAAWGGLLHCKGEP